MTKKTKANLLRKYKNLSRVLTHNNELTIRFSGSDAYRVPGLINLPLGDFSDDEFITMSLGYCDHELGHENYTDSNWYTLAHGKSLYLQKLLNALDDYHQEKRLIAEYRGTKNTLRKLVELCKVKGLFAPIPEDGPIPAYIFAWVLYKARSYLGQPLSDLFTQTDNQVLVKFGKQFYDDLHALLDQDILDGLINTEQCFTAAESIYLLLIDWVKDQQEDEPTDSDDANGTDDSEDDPSDSDDANGTDDSEGDSSDSDDANGTDDSEGDSSDSDDANGTDDSEGDSSDSDDAKTRNGVQERALTEEVIRMLQEIEDFDDDFHEKLKATLNAMAEENPSDNLSSLPFLNDSIQVPLSDGRYVDENCRGLIASIKSPLKKIFHDQNYVNHSYKNRGKTISSSRLAGVGVGNTKVFESETIHRSPNAAIALLVDKSGSMSADDMRMANSIAYSLSSALDGIHGVESMVGYYPFRDSEQPGYHFSVVKPFGAKKSAEFFNITPDYGTPTAEAISTAVSCLIIRPEPRKLLFVITDGDPNSPYLTEQAIEEAQQLGVKVFGIGIRQSIKGFSETDFQVIHSTGELVNALTKGLKHAFN